MGKIVKIYENNPDNNLLNQIVEKLERGAVVIFPTDSFYAVGCSISNIKSINRVIEIKGKKNLNLSIMCRDIKMVSDYIQLPDNQFKLLKENTPNPVTFVFKLNKRMPNAFFNLKKSIGVRIPDNKILMEILKRVDVPIVTTTVALKNATEEEGKEPSLVWDEYCNRVDIMIDGGEVRGVPTMVVDLCGDEIEIIRENSDIELKGVLKISPK